MLWTRRFKWVLFIALLVPFVAHLTMLLQGKIIDPVEELTGESGEWALRCLMLTLAVTPLRHLTGLGSLTILRRMLGLFAFFYASCHVVVYVWLDQYFAWADILEDIVKRKYIFAGFLGFVLMIPLAATSFNRAIRWLGSKRWQKLHRLVYVCGIAAVVHYFWLVKSDYTEPLVYGAILTVLFAARIWQSNKRKRRRRKPASAA